MGITTAGIVNAANRFSAITAAIGTLAPLIGILIDTVQKAVPAGETAGAQKFAAVMDGAKNWLIHLGNDAAAVESLVPTIALGINTAVDAYKGRIVPTPNGGWTQAAPATPAPSAP